MAKENIQYISLSKATEYCNYSQEYLSLRARQGKLKAKKFGRNWVTTKEWLDEYVLMAQTYNQKIEKNKKRKIEVVKEVVKEIKPEPPQDLPVGKFIQPRKSIFKLGLPRIILPSFALPRIPAKVLVAAALVLLLIAGSVFGRETLKSAWGKTLPYLNETLFVIANGFDRNMQRIEIAAEDLDELVLKTVQAVVQSAQRVSVFSQRTFSDVKQGGILIVQGLGYRIETEIQAIAFFNICFGLAGNL